MTNSNYSEYMFLYMNGELSPRDVHFLEHNDNFMRAVMLYGKNYRFFDRCSKNIKNDSEYQSQAESRKNAYVIMIIDGSKSFKENSKIAKEKAIEMRKIVTK